MTLNRDTLLFVGYAVAQAALTLSASHGWLSKDDVQTYSEVLLAFAAAYHIPNAKAAAALRDQKATPSPAEAPEDTPPVEAQHASNVGETGTLPL